MVRTCALGTLLVAASGCGRIGFGAIADDAWSGGDVVLVSDDFGRALANDWGNADIGGAWQIYNPNGANVGVAGDHAFAALAAPNMYANFHVDSVTALDSEVRVVALFDQRPTSGFCDVLATIRWVASGTAYRLVAGLDPSGNVELRIQRGLSGTDTDLTSPIVALVGVAAGDRIALSLRSDEASPTHLCGRSWRDGSPEPASCTVMADDSSALLQVPGISYLEVNDGSSGTPTTVSFETFRFLRVGPE
jgi:hypothetical protein